MSYYDRFSSEAVKVVKELNDKLIAEEKSNTPDKEKILKLQQQILMKGLEMSVGFNVNNYNPYR
jgi:hypothetical protein